MDRFYETPRWVRDLEVWLAQHDTTSDLITVWTLVACFLVLGTVNVAAWWALRDQRDRTALGWTLKRKKLAEGIAELGMAALYGLTLWGYYQGYQFGPFWRYSVRLLVALALLGGALWGVRFVLALRAETRRNEPTPT
jgi:purine-cytosine permease-like protein